MPDPLITGQDNNPSYVNPLDPTNPAAGTDPFQHGGLFNLSNKQIASAFANPYTDAISQNIRNGPVSNTANQVQSSPLAGITTLGGVANAGVANAVNGQAGLSTAGNTNINTGVSDPILQGQISNINQLNAQAHGQGPSLAGLQAQQSRDANIAGTMAMMGSQRGASNSALGMRSAMEHKGLADQQAAQQAVQGRAQEQLAAQQQLTGALGGTQGQVMQGAQQQAGLNQATNFANQNATNDMSKTNLAAAQQTALANAGAQNTANLQNASSANQSKLQQGSMDQQVALANAQQQATETLANLQAKQQTQGLNAQEYNDMLQAQMTLASNNQQASENYANAMINQNTSYNQMRTGQQAAQQANQLGLIGAGIGGGAALGAGYMDYLGGQKGSDIKLKTNIKSADRSIKDFLSQIGTSNTSAFNLMSNR